MKKNIELGTAPRYAKEKPEDCRDCSFWNRHKNKCRLGKSNCYYLMSAPPKVPNPCEGCTYGQSRPCVGICYKGFHRMRKAGEADEQGR